MTKSIAFVVASGALLMYWPTNGSILFFVASVFYLLGKLAGRQPRVPNVPARQGQPTAGKPGDTQRHLNQMMQKGKDAALRDYVLNGNHEWSKKQNEAAAKMKHAARMSAGAAAMQANLPMGSGSGMHRQQMAQQAAWTNQAAAMEMADAADLMMDAAVENDPFNF